MSKRWFVVFGLMLAILCAGPTRVVLSLEQVMPAEEAMLVDVAKEWMGLLDKGKYDESWDKAGALFRSGVKDKWVGMISSARIRSGPMVSRRLLEKYFVETLPGAPVGEYYTLIFATAFAGNASCIEMVNMSKDPEGKWRVAGYTMK
ncbi:MAG: DUF4019 domain-containing protein [Candidatus Omnitrophica bacterium]|nr:DUF4019 domain-containing protein [Candidatus Omnitrophota bacterium]